MKKLLNILCITLAIIFTLSLFSGCTPNNTADPTPTPTEEASAPTPTPKPNNTAPDSSAVKELFNSVLEDKQTLYSALAKKDVNLSSYFTGLSESGCSGLWKYSAIDFDSDGTSEFVVKLHEDTIIVLRKNDDKVAGFEFDTRSMYRINKDGTFLSISEAGTTYGVSKLEFSQDGFSYTEIELMRADYSDVTSFAYYLDGKSVSQEEYDSAYDKLNSESIVWTLFYPESASDAEEFNKTTLSDVALSTFYSDHIIKTISKKQFYKDIECYYNDEKITLEPIFTGIPVSAVDTYKKNFLFVDGTVILNVSTQNGTTYFKVGKDGKISVTDTDFKKINEGRDNSKYYPEQRVGLEGRVVGNDVMIIQEGEFGNYVQYLHTTKGECISKGYDSIGYFYNGLAIITQDKKVGLIDESGNEVLAPCIAFDTIIYQPKAKEFSPDFMSEDAIILPIDGEIVVINIKRTYAPRDKRIGVAFIDFYESYNQYLQEIKDSQYLTDYPALNEVLEKEFISVSDGTETFLIMPAELTASVQVYKLIRGYDKTIKEETLQSELLYESKNAKPLVVKCNFSDVVSDVNIVITYKDGSTVEFSPACSGKGWELDIVSKNKELINDLTKWYY